ncbi:MAG: beta-lactamase family protein, partial [Actinomycetota bacterium]|nr:beta-lactamase family protein [Actinomycetota bacterium]
MKAWSKEGLDRLDERVARHVAADGVPGAAWLTARGGEVHAGYAGTIDGLAPVQRDSIFRIASMTKPVTAAAVLALAEDCVLRLDDPLDRWLPELADRRVMGDPKGSVDDTVAAARQPTVHDALTFRLGWGMDFADWQGQTLPGAIAAAMGLEVGPPQPSKTPPPAEFVAVLGRFPLDRQPGEKWLYNTGSDVLGVVVERAAGKRFGDVLAERIFGPLGMRDTAFH